MNLGSTMEQRCTKKFELYYICHPSKKSLIFAKSKSFNLAVPEKYVCKKIFGKNVAKNKKFHTDLKKSFKFAKNYSYWQFCKLIFAKRFLPKILQKLAKI